MNFRALSLCCFLLLICQSIIADTVLEHIDVHRDFVLGTSLDIDVYIEKKDTVIARTVIEQAINEIADLENILSTYKPDSSVNKLNKKRRMMQLPDDLKTVFEHCEHWKKLSTGKFSCRLGKIKQLWQDAEKTQITPNRAAIRKLARSIERAQINLNEDDGLSLPEHVAIDADGLAKGYIIDHTFSFLKHALQNAQAIRVDIGGDGRYWRRTEDKKKWQVGITDPNNVSDNRASLATLNIHSKAIAASGHTSRTRKIAHREFSHILEPNEGWPLFQAPAAIVVANDAVTADAVATALSVQEMTAGIDWVNQLENVEALVVSPEGLQLASEQWSQYLGGSKRRQETFQLSVDYTIPKFDADIYNKPYVAIWITDSDRKPIKNLLLLGESERWARENTRWWRRVGRVNPSLLDSVARATRRPGNYRLQWDGSDDFGAYVKTGTYILHFEAAREHGGHNYQKIELNLSDKPFKQNINAAGELGAIKLHYSPTP